jgi:glucosamine-6-phosphate deaminase
MEKALRVHVYEDSEALAAAVASDLARVMIGDGKTRVNVGLATGSTPIPLYRHLVELLRGKDLSHVSSFNLDEYEGLEASHPESYRHYMREHLFAHIGVPAGNVFFPEAGRDYDALIAERGGLDVQVLGIGTNGHIGFNEPGSARDSRTRRVELSQATRAANARFFGGDAAATPSHAVTMGVATIAGARRTLLLATGAGKAAVMAQLLNRESRVYDASLPATALLAHAGAEFHLDRPAAAQLKHK